MIAKPRQLARASFLLYCLERFNYPSLAAVGAESSELMQLLAIERLGTPEQEGR